jgi:copper transport protein
VSARHRAVVCALIAAGAMAVGATPAGAHASLVGSTPRAGGHVPTTAPSQVRRLSSVVTLRFSESVRILARTDVTVVDRRGRRVDAGAPRTLAADPRAVVVPLPHALISDSYTVRYRVVSADSHAVDGAFVFAVGTAPLGPPILAGSGGLSDTSPAAVAARVAELATLGLLLGLLVFRALVWAPAVEAVCAPRAAERAIALQHERRLFWRAFWALTALAGVAEAAVLHAKSAVVFHTGLAAALVHPADASHLVAATRFGDLLGWRGGALLALVAVGFFAWTAEDARGPSTQERRSAAVMMLLATAALALLAEQGHASQAPLAPLSVAADTGHLAGAAIWIGGLPWLLVVLLGAPRALSDHGRALAGATLGRFSRIALWSVVVVALTGLARMAGEMSAPDQLWSTGYGRTLALKAGLLVPILMPAARNRRLVRSLARGATPTASRLRAVTRDVRTELAIGIGIVILAALLVAEIPGRG